MTTGDFRLADKLLVQRRRTQPLHQIAAVLPMMLASAVASTRPHLGRFGHRSTAIRGLALARDVLSAAP